MGFHVLLVEGAEPRNASPSGEADILYCSANLINQSRSRSSWRLLDSMHGPTIDDAVDSDGVVDTVRPQEDEPRRAKTGDVRRFVKGGVGLASQLTSRGRRAPTLCSSGPRPRR